MAQASFFVPCPTDPGRALDHGLDYGAGWGVTRQSSGATVILKEVQTAPRGPTNIAVDKPSGYASYALQAFDWFSALNLQQGAAIVAANTTLVLDGTTDKGVAVQATCEYNTALLGGVSVAGRPKTAKCTPGPKFARVTNVTFSIGSGLAALRVVALADLTYVLHKCSA